jgi:hypothetical protein
MTKINNNNLDAIKAYYALQANKKANKEEKQEEAKPVVGYEPKKVDVSALDATAAQIWGVQLSKVDTSDAAVEKRLEQAFANSSFMQSLDELVGDDDFVSYAQANMTGVNQEKLAKYLNKPLSQETTNGLLKMA